MASAAVPGLFKPVTLKRRTPSGRSIDYLLTEQWSDGSLVEMYRSAVSVVSRTLIISS